MKQELQIRCKNNKKTENISIGSSLSEIFDEINLKMDFGPVSAKVNNKVEGLNYRVYHNKDVEFLDLYSSSGMRAYTRTLFFILCKAANDIFKNVGMVGWDVAVTENGVCLIEGNSEASYQIIQLPYVEEGIGMRKIFEPFLDK